MKDCLRYAPMIGAREGELSAADARALALHLETCDACVARAADLAATGGLLSEALLARASARDFAPFVDQVMARVEAEAARAPAPGRPARGRRSAESRGVLSWLHAHWRATAATLAPALAAAAVFMYVRSGSGPEVALLEISTEGNVATVLQTSDGPVVLLAAEESGS